ncbi:MAG: sigma-70 family RNA polymerase sigma factor [Clostridia bacterium]|nr:sigma-70 family RNA polymerase sigma factor [Clostridia bacterium]
MDIDKKEVARCVRDLKLGDGAAFERLYNLTNKSAYFTALKIVKNEHDAQDVLQESYMIVLDNILNLKKPESFMSWFNMIVANKAREILRENNKYSLAKSESDAALNESLQDNVFSEVSDPEAETEKNDLNRQISSLIDKLDDDKRITVLLYYYNELTIKQIAELTEVSPGTVKSRLHYAKKELTAGIMDIEKKNGKLFTVAPIPLFILALKTASSSASSAFVSGGAAAATYSAITAGSAAGTAAGTASAAAAAAASAATAGASTVAVTGAGLVAKAVGFTATQKDIAGVAAAAVIGGTAAGAKKAVDNKIQPEVTAHSVSESVSEPDLSTKVQKAKYMRYSRTSAEESQTETVKAGETAEKSTTLPDSETVGQVNNTTRSPKAKTTASVRSTRGTTATLYSLSASVTHTQPITTVKTATTQHTSTRLPEKSTKSNQTKPQSSATSTKHTETSPKDETGESNASSTTVTSKVTTSPNVSSTLTITVTRNGIFAETIHISLNEGDVYTFSDAKAAVAAKGYDTSFAEYSGTPLPLTAESNRNYSLTIDVE